MKKLCFTLVLALCTIIAWAETVTVDGIKYSLDGENAVVQSDTYSGDIVIPESFVYDNVTYNVTGIADWAFSYCTDLQSIEIPNSITSIGSNAFYTCYSLTSVVIPNSVTYIGEGAFSGCAKLTSATLSESLTSIEPSVFHFCLKLESIKIPESVTSIGKDAFYNCSDLKTLTIGSSVATIGNFAFYECSGLESVTNLAATPQTISTSTFFSDKIKLSETNLFVPQASVEAYKEANIWQKFNIVGIEEDGIERINVNDNDNDNLNVNDNLNDNYNDNLCSRKVVENGKVIIETSNGKYSLGGQRIK